MLKQETQDQQNKQDNKSTSNYFVTALFILILAVCFFESFYWLGEMKWIPTRLFPEETNESVGVSDSLAIEAMQDTLAIDSTPLAIDSILLVDSTKQIAPPSDTATSIGFDNLSAFFQKLLNLEKTKKGHVRVAYFGDSMIGGDLIVQDIRKNLQDSFGGNGVGFVGITSLSASARASVSHEYASDWKTQSFLLTRVPQNPFGIDGQVSFAVQPTWVKYRANTHSHQQKLYRPKLFYGLNPNEADTLQMITESDSERIKVRPSHTLLNVLSLSSNNLRRLQINFPQDSVTPFYGVDFSDSIGVHVDNFSIRGNSGLPLSAMNVSLMNQFDKYLQYDLIVLHYGANVLHLGTTNYSWYRRAMNRTVKHLRICFPHADILIISTADKSDKVGTDMQTSSAVLPLIEAQKQYAQESNAAFINLYQLMGGSGSMVEWEGDGMANKDYTHFNYKGAHKVAQLIFQEINTAYNTYKTTKPNE